MAVLYAKVDGNWVPVSGGSGSGGVEEVFVGPSAPTGLEEIWYDTDAPGYTGADLRWQSAWGEVYYQEITATNLSLTTTPASLAQVDLTGLTVGRKLRITISSGAGPTVSTLNSEMYWGIGDTANTVWRRTRGFNPTANTKAGPTQLLTYRTTTTAATLSFRLLAWVQAGTGLLAYSTATEPVTVLVEDIGPSVGYSPEPISILDRWNTAWGIVALGSFVGGSGYSVPAGTDVRFTNLLAFTSVVGRRYRMRCQVRVIGTTTGNGVNFLPHGPDVGGSSWDLWHTVTGTYGYVNMDVIFNGGGVAGNYWWGVSHTVNIGFFLDSMSNFYIEDMGPVSGAVAIADPTPQWIRPTFENGWDDYGYPGWERAGYRKIGDIVYLRGLVKRAAGDLNQQPMFTVPAGYRPPAPLIFNVNSSLTTYANARYDVQPTGACYVNDGRPGYAGFTSLSGVFWSVTP